MNIVLRNFAFFSFSAVFILNSCSRNPSKEELSKFFIAKKFYENKKLDMALPLFKELAKKSYFASADFMAGKILYYTREHKEADKYFRSAIEKKENYVDAQFWFVKNHMIMSKWLSQKKNRKKLIKKYLKVLNRILEIDTYHVDARMLKGFFLRKLGKIRLAISQYQATLQQLSKLSTANIRLGQIYLEQGLTDQAEKYFTVAKIIAPQNQYVKKYIEFLKRRHEKKEKIKDKK